MFTCTYCNYNTTSKSNYNKHLFTKKHANNIKLNNTYNDIDYCKIKNDMINDKMKYICENCNQKYKYKQGLYKHKMNCKKNINNNQIIELSNNDINTKMNMLLQQINNINNDIKIIKEKKEIINNNSTTNYIQNNIKLLSYKNTDISHLTDKHFIKCLSKINMCIPSLIILLHFNSNKPENYNTYISNIKNKYILFYDGTKWNYKNRDDGLNELFYKGQNILECKIDEWEETGKEYPTAMNNYKRFLKNIDNDSVVEEIKKAIELILYNHRDIVKNSK